MKPKNSTHAAGHAAYTHNAARKEGADSAASSDGADETRSSAEPQDTRLRQTEEGGLTAQEENMIEESFPEDPELSMRLYGRGRDTETVRGRAIGENIDVTG